MTDWGDWGEGPSRLPWQVTPRPLLPPPLPLDRFREFGRYPQQSDGGGRMLPSLGHSWRHPPHRPLLPSAPPYPRFDPGPSYCPPASSWRPSRSDPVPYYGPAAASLRQNRGYLGPDRYEDFRDNQIFRPYIESTPDSTTPSYANTKPSELDQQRYRAYVKQPLYTNFDTIQSISLSFEVSARVIDVSWLPLHLPANRKYSYNLEVDGDRDLYNLEMPWHKTKHAVKTSPGAVYKFTLTCKAENGIILARSSKEVKAVFSIDELRRLHSRAIELNGSDMHSFRFLYRCKPQSYWNDIYTNCRGIMEPYAKDNNGQPSNAINGAISGLFFSARLFHGELPTSSPFGDRRLRIEAPFLLDTRKHVMYFADFYCNNALHYVTIVICIRDSITDRFCSPRLIRLNPETNPFLRIQYYPPCRNLPDGGHEYFVNKNVWVEVFYTESIDITYRQLDHIQATGMGTSRIGGLPNNKYCELCNLYPLLRPNAGSKTDGEVDPYGDDISPRESTIMLCNSLNLMKEKFGEDWNEVVGTVCHLVDQTCEQMENDFGVAAAEQRSLARLDKVMDEMSHEIELCGDIEVHAIADDIRSMVERFKDQRQQFLDLLSNMEATRRSLAEPPDMPLIGKPNIIPADKKVAT